MAVRDHGSRQLPPTLQWLHQRAIGKCRRLKQTSREQLERLRLETVLKGHSACVNCLQWNQQGNLLASGSDDCHIIVWDPFQQQQQENKRHILHTGHEGNIFSVKFMPNSNDSLLATCATDCAVKCLNIYNGEPLLNCKYCHHNRVKRLEVHPNEPNLIWSAGEDGYVMQYDLRQRHVCKSKSSNVLIDLNEFTHSSAKAAKCLAINPVRDEQLAIGSDDVYVRVVDRRMLYRTRFNDRSGPSFVTIFSPGHLQKRQKLLKSSTAMPLNYARPVGATYLAFSPNGRELLVNMHAEQAYLFNVQEPTERYKSYEATVEPLILDKTVPNLSHLVKRNKKTYSQWRELKKIDPNNIAKLTSEQRQFYEELSKKLRKKQRLALAEHDRMNQLLVNQDECIELYHLRASALIDRGWRGDYYQAIRDSCCALALDPLDFKSLQNMALAMYQMKDNESVMGMLELMKIIVAQFGDQFEATELVETLEFLTDCVEKSKIVQKNQTQQTIAAMTHQANGWNNNNNRYHHHLTPPGTDEEDGYEEDRTVRSRSTSPMVPPSDEDDDDMGLRTHAGSPRDFYLNNNNGGGGTSSRNMRRSIYFDYTEVGSVRFVRNKLQWPEPSEIDETAPEAFDYNQRYCGHCNMNTDIKEVNFFGEDGDYIVGGSDDGACYIWDKESANIVKAVQADQQILNCIQAHPNICMLATSGIEPTVKIWSPSGTKSHDIKSLETRCSQNQVFLNSDPLEAMIMMLYQGNERSGDN